MSLFTEVTNLGASATMQRCEERTQNRVLRRNTASRQHSILLLKRIFAVVSEPRAGSQKRFQDFWETAIRSAVSRLRGRGRW